MTNNGVGFEGVDPFEFRVSVQIQMFGSGKVALQFAQDCGVERFVNMFCIGYNEKPITLAGQQRGIERWYYEMGTPGGLVDFPALLGGLQKHDYEGWIVAESDQNPHAEESVMLNGWYQKRVLARV